MNLKVANVKPWFLAAVLALVTSGVYWQVRTHDFVNFDDLDYVSANPAVQAGLKWESVRWAFTQVHSSNWHPVTWLSHMMDCQLFGVKPAGHHLTNVFFHVANTLLLFRLLQRLTGALWRGAMVAALFALHPLHVESVAWVAERKDVLSTFFGLLTLLAYGRYAQRQASTAKCRMPYYFAALVIFALGLMSKPMLVTWPFVMLLLDVWPLKRVPGPKSDSTVNLSRTTWSRLIVEKLPFFALSIASCIVTVIVQRLAGATISTEALPIEYRLAQAPVACLRYLSKTLWPEHLAVFYPYEVLTWSSPWVLGATVLLIAITAAALAQLRRRPFLSVGWFWFLGTLVPVIGLVQVGRQAIADRYTYIPLIGVFVAIVWLAAELTQRWNVPRAFRFMIAATVLLACGTVTARQLTSWRNTASLASHAAAVTTGNYMAHAQLAATLTEAGKYDEALMQCRRALELRPNFVEALNTLAAIHVRQTNYAAAIAGFQEAIRCDPTFPDAHHGLADVYFKSGNFAEAEIESRATIRLLPMHIGGWYLLAQSQHSQGKLVEAIASYRRLLELKPDLFPAHRGLASVLTLNGDLTAAVTEYEVALKLQPKSVDTHNALGIVLLSRGEITSASNQFALALSYQPTNAIASYQVAALLSASAKPAEAAKYYRVALLAQPDWPEALNNFSWLLATSVDPAVRNGAEAVRLAERACTLTNYKEPLLVGTLAAAYAEAGRFDDAIQTAELAIQTAQAAGLSQLVERNAALLKVYREKKSHHEIAP